MFGEAMEDQRRVFLDSEGDRYFLRNAQKLHEMHAAAMQDPSSDPILKDLVLLRPKSILEVGAANGWRLDIANRLWGAKGIGVEPSAAAVEDGRRRYSSVEMYVGTADKLPDQSVECVVFGGCLYLCDSADQFRIAAEADRVLEDHGYLVIFDFYPPVPYRNPYSHRSGVFSRKMDYSKLWTWHPAYVLWSQRMLTNVEGFDPINPDSRMATTVLRKFIA